MLRPMSTNSQHKDDQHTVNQHSAPTHYNQDGDSDITEQAALLVLLEHSNDPAKICRQVEECGSAFLLLSQDGATGSISEQQSLLPWADWNNHIDDMDKIKAEMSNWRELGIHFAAFFDNEYPPQLLTIRESPPFITWYGTIERSDANGIAIVGTRHPGKLALATAHSLAYQLSAKGITVISGLAAGIDSAAHQGALEAGGRSVAIIGTGLLHTYPPSNTELQEEIAATGAVISQFLPDAPPSKDNFPARNAIMSGYAGATLVVEASWKSGARLQARLATQHGRPLFFTKQMLNEDWVHQYLHLPSTHVIEDADDLIDTLGRYQIDDDTLEWGADQNAQNK